MEQNGLGMTPPMVDRAIELWLDLFNLLRDERGVFSIWHELVRQHHVRGKNAHDARLVAAMRRHNLVHLLTFNASDFQRYSEITVLDARTVDAEP
jgi:predicted nucleic acid-binding protein